MGTYPLSSYHFKVDWGGVATGFTEVSGLTIENEIIEYRDGANPNSNVVKMPGLRKFSNIVLRRGIVKGDNDFFNWINTVQHNAVQRRNITISLLNETHQPVRIYRVHNAWPCKIESSTLKADGNEVAIETIELAHEGLVIEVV